MLERKLILDDGTEIEGYAARDNMGDYLWIFIENISESEEFINNIWLTFRDKTKTRKITYIRDDEIVNVFDDFVNMYEFKQEWNGRIVIGMRKG